jgi:hypothetical protein
MRAQKKIVNAPLNNASAPAAANTLASVDKLASETLSYMNIRAGSGVRRARVLGCENTT